MVSAEAVKVPIDGIDWCLLGLPIVEDASSSSTHWDARSTNTEMCCTDDGNAHPSIDVTTNLGVRFCPTFPWASRLVSSALPSVLCQRDHPSIPQKEKNAVVVRGRAPNTSSSSSLFCGRLTPCRVSCTCWTSHLDLTSWCLECNPSPLSSVFFFLVLKLRFFFNDRGSSLYCWALGRYFCWMHWTCFSWPLPHAVTWTKNNNINYCSFTYDCHLSQSEHSKSGLLKHNQASGFRN
jgi:hypothetical protein